MYLWLKDKRYNCQGPSLKNNVEILRDGKCIYAMCVRFFGDTASEKKVKKATEENHTWSSLGLHSVSFVIETDFNDTWMRPSE